MVSISFSILWLWGRRGAEWGWQGHKSVRAVSPLEPSLQSSSPSGEYQNGKTGTRVASKSLLGCGHTGSRQKSTQDQFFLSFPRYNPRLLMIASPAARHGDNSAKLSSWDCHKGNTEPCTPSDRVLPLPGCWLLCTYWEAPTPLGGCKDTGFRKNTMPCFWSIV